MLIKAAKALARQWVLAEASQTPGFSGAFYAGSTTWLPDDTPFPATSDVDVWVVLDDANSAAKLGKFVYQGVILEVSYIASAQLQSPAQILGDYHLAGSFRTPSIIVDPSGQLTQIQAAVAKAFAQRQWVYKRCEHARDRVLQNLQQVSTPAPFRDQVMAWLFATGVTTHVLLVAGLKNPTVRQRYVAVQELLKEYNRLNFYQPLLALLGCDQMSRARAEDHLAALTAVFDTTKTLIKTPFFFTADISDLARPVAIEGSRDLIARGLHRDAIFWILATYSRCLKVLYADAPAEVQAQFAPGYQQLLGDLGIQSLADLQQRGEQVKAFLSQLWAVTETILAATPGIEA